VAGVSLPRQLRANMTVGRRATDALAGAPQTVGCPLADSPQTYWWLLAGANKGSVAARQIF